MNIIRFPFLIWIMAFVIQVGGFYHHNLYCEGRDCMFSAIMLTIPLGGLMIMSGLFYFIMRTNPNLNKEATIILDWIIILIVGFTCFLLIELADLNFPYEALPFTIDAFHFICIYIGLQISIFFVWVYGRVTR